MRARHLVGFLHWAFRVLIIEAVDALFDWLLLHLVGLASHGRLVERELRRLEEEAVDGDSHAVLDVDDVTDVEVVVVEGFFLTFAGHTALK